MTEKISTDIVVIDKNVSDIEMQLRKIVGADIVRWAVVEVLKNAVKVCYSYKC